jgi:hypothetical protein
MYLLCLKYISFDASLLFYLVLFILHVNGCSLIKIILYNIFLFTLFLL